LGYTREVGQMRMDTWSVFMRK